MDVKILSSIDKDLFLTVGETGFKINIIDNKYIIKITIVDYRQFFNEALEYLLNENIVTIIDKKEYISKEFIYESTTYILSINNDFLITLL